MVGLQARGHFVDGAVPRKIPCKSFLSELSIVTVVAALSDSLSWIVATLRRERKRQREKEVNLW